MSAPKFISPVELLVLQSTSFCNINCKYCYLSDRDKVNKMSLACLDRILSKLFESTLVENDFTIVWHAGEPLTLSGDYYLRANDIIKSYSSDKINISQSFQTNGMLIDENWCEVFSKIQAKVGVSIDGPDFLHDKYRLKRNNSGSHSQSLNGLKLLQKHEIPNHVICVLTRDSLAHPDEIFDFFLDNGIRNLGFNVEENEGINIKSSLDDINEIEVIFIEFINKIYYRYKNCNSKISIREFEQTFQLITHNSRTSKGNSQNIPGSIITVDYQGNVSSFSPELIGSKSEYFNNFILGNIHSHSFDQILNSEITRKINREISLGIENCKNTCDYFPVCGGGAPSNKFFENNDLSSTETVYCKLTKKLITDTILNDLEQVVIQKGQPPVLTSSQS